MDFQSIPSQRSCHYKRCRTEAVPLRGYVTSNISRQLFSPNPPSNPMVLFLAFLVLKTSTYNTYWIIIYAYCPYPCVYSNSFPPYGSRLDSEWCSLYSHIVSSSECAHLPSQMLSVLDTPKQEHKPSHCMPA